MVIAIAGRRISAPGSKTIRFPLENVGRVRERLRELFASTNPKLVVSSGACGADLLALEVAGSMGILRSMVLPFDTTIFKSTSVTDRPGDWGELFDRICKEVQGEEKIDVHHYTETDVDSTFRKTNFDILDRAEVLAEKYGLSKNITAVIVWDGKRRDADDVTDDFRRAAIKKNFPIKEINTL